MVFFNSLQKMVKFTEIVKILSKIKKNRVKNQEAPWRQLWTLS